MKGRPLKPRQGFDPRPFSLKIDLHTTPTLVVNPFRPVDNPSAGRCICHKSLRYNDSSEIFVAYLCLYLP
ncbi:hypothetical protein C4K10_6209 [Pseudomonas chlororaphis subsp. aureofaciens]|nr:hypothetical protein C4K10_6209 [Pseudomonas chlororaphis subsp. aureofaciens]